MLIFVGLMVYFNQGKVCDYFIGVYVCRGISVFLDYVYVEMFMMFVVDNFIVDFIDYFGFFGS